MCTTPQTLTGVHQALGNNLARTAFLYTRCTVSSSRTPHSCHKLCTQTGGHIEPCTLGVQRRKRSRQFTRPWGRIWRKRNFHVPTVQFPQVRRHTAALGCVHKLYTNWRSRRALYTRCTTPQTLTAVHQAVGNNLAQTEFSCTHCTVSSSPTPYSCLRLCTQTVHKLEVT